MEADGPSTSRTPYNSFSASEFYETTAWERLAKILTGNGGVYGLHGPRGSGKSWLMLQAIEQVNKDGGIGLWFPCPSSYETTTFLSALLDNIANAVEARYVPQARRPAGLRWTPIALVGLAFILFMAQLASSVIHGALTPGSLFSLRTLWLWIAVGALLTPFAVLWVRQAGVADRSSRRLAREASSLFEGVRYSRALTTGSEAGVSSGGTGLLGGSVKRKEERSLSERPSTIASLAFDFRRFAERVVDTTGKPIVIGIDELDKIADPEAVWGLLRDIKGIFEISRVFFLVSVSAETATTLQLGPLQGAERNEFNSLFYTVIELPPLSPVDISSVIGKRHAKPTDHCAQLLCLLSAGNWREMTRQAEVYLALEKADASGQPVEFRLAMTILKAEAAALQRDIIRLHHGGAEANRLLTEVWHALPTAAFKSPHAFIGLSESAINAFWTLPDTTEAWRDAISESWCRFLIRLFVVGQALTGMRLSGGTSTIDGDDISDLRDVLIMASHSTAVAKLMLQVRCGDDLASPYSRPPS